MRLVCGRDGGKLRCKIAHSPVSPFLPLLVSLLPRDHLKHIYSKTSIFELRFFEIISNSKQILDTMDSENMAYLRTILLYYMYL